MKLVRVKISVTVEATADNGHKVVAVYGVPAGDMPAGPFTFTFDVPEAAEVLKTLPRDLGFCLCGHGERCSKCI